MQIHGKDLNFIELVAEQQKLDLHQNGLSVWIGVRHWSGYFSSDFHRL